MAGLPLSKGRPLYLVTKHTKFNYSGKGELCFQHRKVIHMRWTPLLFCFPQCFHYDGSFLSFGGGRLRTCRRLIQCHFAWCVFCVLFQEHTICLSWAFTVLLVLRVQTSFLQLLVWQAFLPLMLFGWFTTKKSLTDCLDPGSLCVMPPVKQLHSAVTAGCMCFYVNIVKNAAETGHSKLGRTASNSLPPLCFPSTHLHNSYSERKKTVADKARLVVCVFVKITACHSLKNGKTNRIQTFCKLITHSNLAVSKYKNISERSTWHSYFSSVSTTMWALQRMVTVADVRIKSPADDFKPSLQTHRCHTAYQHCYTVGSQTFGHLGQRWTN